MKTFLLNAFLILYVASSYVVTQERVALEARQFLGGDSQNTSIDNDGSREPLSLFPRYRQAKPKGAADPSIEMTVAVFLAPYVSSELFASESASHKIFSSTETVLSRAPPALL
jgi:hypothetical protein